MTVQVFSEVGPLRRVMVHRPGSEIERMVPAMMERLLFDDILDREGARREHRQFRDLLEKAGVEVLDPEDLLREVFQKKEVRLGLVEELVGDGVVPRDCRDHLEVLEGDEFTEAMIAGLRAEPSRIGHYYELPPLPNYFFQRDPLFMVGDRIFASSMATDAREREPYLSAAIVDHHPTFNGHTELHHLGATKPGAPDIGPAYEFPTVEGGDVLVASPEVVIVGSSERTNVQGVEVLAEELRRVESSFRYLVMVVLPQRRSFMHLDTVFTFVDQNLALAHAPLIRAGGPESVRTYVVDLQAKQFAYLKVGSFLQSLRYVGIDLELIPCGGLEIIDQEREQWTDGANTFCVAPGVIFLYKRNRRTIEELDRRGFRVLMPEDALTRNVPLLGEGPTVIPFAGYELSRARGGPRCMTMPLERDLVGT